MLAESTPLIRFKSVSMLVNVIISAGFCLFVCLFVVCLCLNPPALQIGLRSLMLDPRPAPGSLVAGKRAKLVDVQHVSG